MNSTPSSANLSLYRPLPEFSLPDAAGTTVDSREYQGLPALVLAFFDNGSPVCRRVHEPLARCGWEYRMRGIGFLGVNPSAESAEEMAATAQRAGISFPWLIDENQRVARWLGVRRIPDFLVFNRDRRLAYHGRFDGTDRDCTSAFGAAATGDDLRRALDVILRGEGVPVGFPARGHLLEWTEQPQVERAAAVEAG